VEKAYELKALVAILKAQGLEVAEESAKIILTATFQWLTESAEKSPNPYDDFLAKAYPQLKEYSLSKADEINKAD
jgi:hypothetical protein